MGGMDSQEGTAKMVNQKRGERRAIKETKGRLDRRGHPDLALPGQPM